MLVCYSHPKGALLPQALRGAVGANGTLGAARTSRFYLAGDAFRPFQQRVRRGHGRWGMWSGSKTAALRTPLCPQLGRA